MNLTHRIVLLILIIISISTLSNFLLTQYQKESLHIDSEKILARTIIQSLRDALVQDVIDRNKLRVTNLIRGLKENDNPIEFLYVTEGTENAVFAHSFKQGFPIFLVRNKNIHVYQSGVQLTAKYQTQQGLIYEYSEPLIEGLDTTLHIGINQTEITKKLAENNQIVLMISAIITLFVLIIAYLWSKQVTAPLKRITEKIQRFGTGGAIDFSKEKSTTSEIRILSTAFQTAIEERQKIYGVLEEREEAFRQLTENIHEVFWLGSPAWDEVYYISPAYEKIWGQKPEDLYQNPHLWIDAVHPDDREQVIEDIPKDINSIDEHIDFREYRIQKPDGKIVWIKAKAYPIKDQDGQIIRMAGVAEDVSDRIQMEEAVQRTQKMDALGKLTGGIAHDFNNMLGVILGYAELLEEKLADTPQLYKYIKEISSAGNRAKKLTSKLLAFSRKQPSDKKSTNINRLLEKDRHMLEKTLTAKIDLSIEMAKDLWEVCLDEEMLGDSILNMCINSMHAMPDGGKLTISTKNSHLDNSEVQSCSISAGDYVQLSITDTGTGISPEIKEKIFEPFFSTKGDIGTGLGMSQVYGFVKQSNGEIKIFSEPGKGTQIVIYIPKDIDQKNDDCCITPSYEAPIASKNEIILVVDDEPALRELASDILETHDYQVICAENGEEALHMLATKNIDLMLTDVIMPNMDGYQLASQVKQKFPEVKILIASGYNENLKDKDSSDVLYQQLEKPYRSDELLKNIRKLLDE